jgi:hypothetical protein
MKRFLENRQQSEQRLKIVKETTSVASTFVKRPVTRSLTRSGKNQTTFWHIPDDVIRLIAKSHLLLNWDDLTNLAKTCKRYYRALYSLLHNNYKYKLFDPHTFEWVTPFSNGYISTHRGIIRLKNVVKKSIPHNNITVENDWYVSLNQAISLFRNKESPLHIIIERNGKLPDVANTEITFPNNNRDEYLKDFLDILRRSNRFRYDRNIFNYK